MTNYASDREFSGMLLLGAAADEADRLLNVRGGLRRAEDTGGPL